MKKILLLMFSLAALGCNSWLDGAKPKEFTEEEELFSRETGFKEALTGAYQLAAKYELYGRRLTFDYIDKLAQRYRNVGGGGVLTYQQPSFYEFDSKDSRDITDAVWEKMYNVVANINNMLRWIETNRHVLTTPGYYEIIKGEALALRSYIYFDLLRMFGPVYSHDPEGLSIIYRTEFNRESRDLVPADQMLDNIVADLETAYGLLEDHDTFDFNYAKLGAAADEDPFLIFRQNRMNALAVQALLARIHLYGGNAAKAEEYAEEVIESGMFTLNRNNSQDHIMSSEVIFGVHVDRMQENISDRFTNTSEWAINDNTGSLFYDALINKDGDGENDTRVRNGFIHIAGIGTTYHITTKFDQTGLAPGMLGMMPLIRLSEMYYIMSECTGNAYWLNEVRDARGILPVGDFDDEDDMLAKLGTEYRKEFYGEGQLWFFYKRTAADTDRFFNMENVLPAGIEDRHYRFNVPDDEYLFGGLSKE